MKKIYIVQPSTKKVHIDIAFRGYVKKREFDEILKKELSILNVNKIVNHIISEAIKSRLREV